MTRTNFLYGNNTNCDLRPFHREIVKALQTTGQLPEDLADLFEARLVPAEHGNPDGTPRYMIVPRRGGDTVEIALTVKLIGEAMTGNKFWLDSTSREAWVVSRATALGYVLRLSHTQVQWTEEGLEKARRELSEAEEGIDREEEARQAAKDRYSVVKGLWIEPAAKVQTTSDGKRHVMAWIMVDE